MCEHGTTINLTVPIPAHLSHTGFYRWASKPVDSCIADIVFALNEQEVFTASSCCGHGKGPGSILLHDGRTIRIES